MAVGHGQVRASRADEPVTGGLRPRARDGSPRRPGRTPSGSFCARHFDSTGTAAARTESAICVTSAVIAEGHRTVEDKFAHDSSAPRAAPQNPHKSGSAASLPTENIEARVRQSRSRRIRTPFPRSPGKPGQSRSARSCSSAPSASGSVDSHEANLSGNGTLRQRGQARPRPVPEPAAGAARA